MTETLSLSLLGLDNEFPESLFLLYHPSTQRYGCYCHNGVHGLASFSDENSAFLFAKRIEFSGMSSQQVSFDEAREVAKARPMPIVSLMLLDDMMDPKIHYVR